jgi:hypothetical protein
MPDEVLVNFAVNESQSLTIESFHLLKSEFEARNLDLSVLEAVQVDKEIAEATKLSEFEKQTALQFAEGIWQFAFDEKAKGKTNLQIYNALLRKNIDPNYADMLIASIEPKANELVNNFDNKIIIGWMLTIAGILLLAYTLSLDTVRFVFLIWESVLVFGGLAQLVPAYFQKRKFQMILRVIDTEKEDESSLYQ